MRRFPHLSFVPSALLFVFMVGVIGCHSHSLPLPGQTSVQASVQAKAKQVAEANTERSEMDLIPPPSKSRFMAVHSFESWENPYLTVQDSMIQLHITQADPVPGAYGSGGMLRPVAARQQVIAIAPDKLGEAMVSIPPTAWPYGRVVAIEEAHRVPREAEPAVRRTMEGTINRLSDLGVVVYDPLDGTIR